MNKFGKQVWFWSLCITPFTAILTFILTLIVCSQVPNYASPKYRFPQISFLCTGDPYYYFVFGFVILVPQLLVILFGRLQQSQFVIHRDLIYAIHGITLLSSVFLLIMAVVHIYDNLIVHLIGAYGIFGLISLYCFLHTIIIFYLYVHRSHAPQHLHIVYPL